MKKLIVILLIFSVLGSGCALLDKRVVLHPLEGDMFEVPAGTQVGDRKTEKAGWFLSDYYLAEVVKARAEKE